MIRSLTITNYALIEELRVEFPAGLVILTGETGAGKSILIEALGLLLGKRATADVVRSGAERAVVEAGFQTGGNHRLRAFLQENDIEPTEERDTALQRMMAVANVPRAEAIEALINFLAKGVNRNTGQREYAAGGRVIVVEKGALP